MTLPFTGRFPVTIVSSGGWPVTQVSGLDGAYPMTPVTAVQGFPITLTDNAYPVVLVNEDGTEYGGAPGAPSYRLLEGDMQSGTDHRLLEGDMQSGTDKRLLEGDMA